MRKLVLVRHAKSDWGYEGLSDIDRPLNERGYTDAYSMSALFHASFPAPDAIISSPATRAFSTAAIFARAFQYPVSSVEINANIYEAETEVLLEEISKFSDNFETIMCFGHNPGFTNLFNSLSDSFLDNLPTCGILLLEFPFNSWKNVSTGKGKFTYSAFPKEFK